MIEVDDFQAYDKAEKITPTITAIAKSCHTVTLVTRIITMASSFGTLDNIFKDAQANVPITTIIMIPVNAAIGIISIHLEKNNIKHNSEIAATIPDNLPLPPEEIFIIDCPIIAHPPIAPKKPHVILLRP